MWLLRVAGSLVIGAVLGGAAAYLALPRTMTTAASHCTAGAGAADNASPLWDAGAGEGEPAGEATEQSFGDRLNKALFEARGGEAAAQQVLLVRTSCFLCGGCCLVVVRIFSGREPRE